MLLNKLLVNSAKITGISLLALVSVISHASDPDIFTYPAAGQSQEQTQRDRYECYRWAVSATGVDPSTLQEPAANYSTRVVANQNRGDTARGTIIGTIAGAVIGSTIKSGGGYHRGEHRNTAAGAVVGATVGAIIGSQNEQSGYRKAQEQAAVLSEKQQREQQAYEQGINDYIRAFSACMTGRHYSVR
ncbi:hypothetical protein MAH1_24800 [Sessilibacter sp. MAH1]